MHSKSTIKAINGKTPHRKKKEVDFLGQTITTNGLNPQNQNNHEIFWQMSNYFALKTLYSDTLAFQNTTEITYHV